MIIQDHTMYQLDSREPEEPKRKENERKKEFLDLYCDLTTYQDEERKTEF